MMNLLRRSISGWAGRIFFGLILLVFAVAWTVADGFSGASSPSTVLTAGGTRVSVQEYQVAYQQALGRVAQQLQRRPTAEEAAAFGVDQQVLSQLSAGAVLDEHGRRIGLGLSDEGLVRLIAADPTFHDASGNFSRATFRAVLQNAGLSETAYLESLGETSLRTQIVEAVAEGAAAPQAIATALGLYAGERRTVDYITVPTPAAAEIAAPADDTLQTYFDENAARYRAPELRSIQVAVLSADALANPGAVTDEAIEAAYEAGRQRFTAPERRRIQQIVFADRATADAAAQALASGTSFDAVASQAGRSTADIDLGLLARNEVPDAAVGDAAFGLQPNVPSAVVDGVFGPVILRVTEVQPEGVRSLDEVREEIRNELALDTASETANTAYDAFDGAIGRGATFEEAATEAGLQIRAIEAVDARGNDAAGNPIADLPGGSDLLQAVFATDPGFDNPPLTTDDGATLFYEVLQTTPARDRTLDEIRDRVVADWTATEAARLAAERADALRARVEAGESLANVAAAEGLQVSTASSIARSSGAGEIGAAATQAAFAGPSGTLAVAEGRERGQQLVLQVRQVAPPADPLGNVPQNQQQQMSAMLGNDILQSYVTLLQGQYPVDYNPAAVQAAQGALR